MCIYVLTSLKQVFVNTQTTTLRFDLNDLNMNYIKSINTNVLMFILHVDCFSQTEPIYWFHLILTSCEFVTAETWK